MGAPFPNVFYGLLTRWTQEVDSTDFGNVPLFSNGFENSSRPTDFSDFVFLTLPDKFC